MRFTKMQGAGNDYIYLNGFEPLPADLSKLARQMSDRHFGVGSDGLVIIMPSDSCDFRMRMFNSDGSEAEMCGNASRCVGKYVYDKGLTSKKELTLETLAGVKHLTLHTKDNKVERVTVDMGEPILSASDIPVNLPGSPVVAYPLTIEGNLFATTCVSMGNPHAVIFLDDMDRYDLHHIGELIEHHALFPRRTNVEFVEVQSPQHLRMRVWERGAGETLACGTGACASLVAAVLNGKSDRRATLHLLGGDLSIEWNEQNNRIYMTGGAVTVFEGEWPDDNNRSIWY
ncbi:diaminopimelate epimerase [Barnesiella viscericola]|uniref:diaminopimelate epimerase n=1 Tax=Barnesiella viscericola TaxID=397865 RepID=UPI0025A3CFB7|nr:diaminopimelate epimerase [Barnesiella viscericola]MDM8268225.1 diaminopimelate epimerase [Barnesiella viscericola]